MLDTGVFSAQTCNHPPGAAHKSITTREFWRNSYFLFSWISLNADRALYPVIKINDHIKKIIIYKHFLQLAEVVACLRKHMKLR